MSSKKLQTEIDKTFKKINEGLDDFQVVLQKFNSATSPAHKEKFEGDLKREIKKLQRLRDQIKTWQTMSEIKDQKSLEEYRRKIETEMERFKVIEKEIKTKAFSKEGLNKSAKLDPTDVQKNNTLNWINDVKDELQIQMDKFEAEVEALLAKPGKKDSDRIELLRNKLARHHFYIDNLETVQRLIRNDMLDFNEILEKKDDLEYYIECSVDDDFEDTLEVFEGMDLKAVEAKKPQISEEIVKKLEKAVEKSSKPEPKPDSKAVDKKAKPPAKVEAVQPPLPSPVIAIPSLPDNAPSFASAASLNLSKQASLPNINRESKDTTRDPFAFLQAQIETFKKQDTSELSKFANDIYSFYANSSKHVAHGSPYYPTETIALTSNLLQKLSPEALFIAFYYQQGSMSQYLASQELKNRAWRFHKRYRCWFQRLEEPQFITDAHEQGSYLFFDFEESWSQKRKSDFLFEYRYLEEE